MANPVKRKSQNRDYWVLVGLIISAPLFDLFPLIEGPWWTPYLFNMCVDSIVTTAIWKLVYKKYTSLVFCIILLQAICLSAHFSAWLTHFSYVWSNMVPSGEFTATYKYTIQCIFVAEMTVLGWGGYDLYRKYSIRPFRWVGNVLRLVSSNMSSNPDQERN